MNTTVSVIIPTYNSISTIGVAVDSVIAQSYANWELIIVDDGSQDTTLDIVRQYIESYSNIVLIERKREPKGGSVCRNIGAKRARGKYLIFLDADDLLLPNCLERRMMIANNNPGALFVVFPTGIFPNGERTVFSTNNVNQGNYIYQFITSETPWQTTSPIWRKDFFFQTGGFDESYNRLQDPEFMIRALLLAKDQFCAFLGDTPDFLYRIHRKNRNRDFLIMMNDTCNLHYAKLLSLNINSLDRRKFYAALSIFLIVHYDWIQQLRDPQVAENHLNKLNQHVNDSIRPIHIVLLNLFNCLGYAPTRLLIGYLRARCYDVINDRRAALSHRYFIVWVMMRIKSKMNNKTDD